MQEIKEIIKLLKSKKLYPEIKTVDEGSISSQPEFIIKGKKVLSFCSANYLGLANDPRVKKAIIEGIQKYGIHPSGSVLISGTLDIHRKLEKEIAKFLNKEDAMIFNTSTMANMGVIPALVNLPVLNLFSFLKIPSLSKEQSGIIVFSDELNHATIIEGCRLAKAETIIYKHCDMTDLEKSLIKYRKKKRKLIVTDGLFSMDGDIAPLKDIVDLAKKHKAMIYVDDAAGTGILGKNGAGSADHLGVEENIDIIVTTFSKCFGVVGGVAAASKDIIDYLRVTAKTYIFSGAFLGALASGVLKSLEIIKTDKVRREKLWESTRYFKNKLQEAGFNTLNSETPIIPILIGDEKTAINMSEDLFKKGIFSPTIRWPAVPHGQARMRFTVTSQYSKEQLNRLIEDLILVGKKYRVIR